MSTSDRIDVIDLIISVLKEHEGSLDSLVKRLEKIQLDIEESYSESNFMRSRLTGSDETLLKNKVHELEIKLDRYNILLKKLLSHCESINDTVCLRIFANDALEQ